VKISLNLVVYSFSRETPYRFRREFLKVVPAGPEGRVIVDALNRILINIGVPPEKMLSKSDLDAILKDAKTPDIERRTITITDILDLV
jgi:hypothetical protein